MRTYLHKFHLGYAPYYFKRDYAITYEKLANEDLPMDERYSMAMHMRNQIDLQKKQMVDNRFQMFLKATIQLTGDSIGTFSGGVEN